MPDIGTQTDKQKRAKRAPKKENNIIKIKKIKEPKEQYKIYIKPNLLLMFDDDI